MSSNYLGLTYAITSGLAFGALTAGNRLGMFGGYPAYADSMTYLSTCYADLDSPSGLTSFLDNGYGINRPYLGGQTAYSPFGGLGYALGVGISLNQGYGYNPFSLGCGYMNPFASLATNGFYIC